MDIRSSIGRRDFLNLLGKASLVSLVPAVGCQEEPMIAPTEGWKLWLWSRLYGQVYLTGSSNSVPDATVVFRAGLSPDQRFEMARWRSDSLGRYNILAADFPSANGGFFRFILPDQESVDPTRDIPVYCQIDAAQGGRTGSAPFVLQRRPRRDLPNSIDLERHARVDP